MAICSKHFRYYFNLLSEKKFLSMAMAYIGIVLKQTRMNCYGNLSCYLRATFCFLSNTKYNKKINDQRGYDGKVSMVRYDLRLLNKYIEYWYCL